MNKFQKIGLLMDGWTDWWNDGMIE